MSGPALSVKTHVTLNKLSVKTYICFFAIANTFISNMKCDMCSTLL